MLRAVWAYVLYTWGGLHRLFGNANNLRREHERAVHYFSRAYSVNPKMDRALLARGVILWRELGRVDEALKDFDALVEADPADGEALLNRALAQQESGRYDEALADLNAYLQLPEKNAYYHDLALRLHGLLSETVAGADEDSPDETA